MNENSVSDSEVLSKILNLLELIRPESRPRIINTLQTFYGVSSKLSEVAIRQQMPFETTRDKDSSSVGSFSEDRSISPKEFMLEKKPQTDVEKVACLAYYLTHYLSVEGFKTLDISRLNTDAAQIKFSNAAKAMDNAARAGLLIGTTKGQKRISALGELYVQALPDRKSAKEAIAHGKPRRKQKSVGQKKVSTSPKMM